MKMPHGFNALCAQTALMQYHVAFRAQNHSSPARKLTGYKNIESSAA